MITFLIVLNVLLWLAVWIAAGFAYAAYRLERGDYSPMTRLEFFGLLPTILTVSIIERIVR